MSVRILIADDHALIRDGLRVNLEAHGDFEVVGEAVNGRDALAKAEALLPDLIVMDLSMPELNGIDATRLICERLPAVRVLIISMHNSSEHSFRAMNSGAKGFILKESAGEEVVLAVGSLMRGRRYLGVGVAHPVEISCHGRQPHLKSPLESLSMREREVFQYVVEGKSSSEIAVILSLSSKSVDTYRSRLMQKLGVENMPSLISFAFQQGITPPR